jgi:endonuclease G
MNLQPLPNYSLQMPKHFFPLHLVTLAASLFLVSCQKEAAAPGPPPVRPVAPTIPIPEHLTLGNPSFATADPTQPTNYLLSKAQYALSYHRERGIPNWVSWHLSPEWRGSAARQDDFRPDETLPAGWYREQYQLQRLGL